MGGSAEEQAASSKDKSSQSEQAESSASGDSSGSSQQEQQPEEPDTQTASGGQEIGGQIAPSGTGKEGTPETQQQGSSQDIKDQLAQVQQQTGDTSGIGGKDSKPTGNVGRDYLTSLKKIRYRGKR